MANKQLTGDLIRWLNHLKDDLTASTHLRAHTPPQPAHIAGVAAKGVDPVRYEGVVVALRHLMGRKFNCYSQPYAKVLNRS